MSFVWACETLLLQLSTGSCSISNEQSFPVQCIGFRVPPIGGCLEANGTIQNSLPLTTTCDDNGVLLTQVATCAILEPVLAGFSFPAGSCFPTPTVIVRPPQCFTFYTSIASVAHPCESRQEQQLTTFFTCFRGTRFLRLLQSNASICISSMLHSLQRMRMGTASRQRIGGRRPCPKRPKLCRVQPLEVSFSTVPSALRFLQPTSSTNDNPCITLEGRHLSQVTHILFNGTVRGDILSQTNDRLLVRVPCAVPQFDSSKSIPVSITVASLCGKQSNALQLLVTPVCSCPYPTLSALTPTTGMTGTTIVLTGSGFLDAALSEFLPNSCSTLVLVNANGETAFSIVPFLLTPTEISFVLPENVPCPSVLSIQVSVSSPVCASHLSNALEFTCTTVIPVIPCACLAPLIEDIQPPSGPPGTLVTLTGINFQSPPPCLVTVTFNGAPVVPLVHTATVITFIVPACSGFSDVGVQTEQAGVCSPASFTTFICTL